jgi:hypothetical protein
MIPRNEPRTVKMLEYVDHSAHLLRERRKLRCSAVFFEESAEFRATFILATEVNRPDEGTVIGVPEFSHTVDQFNDQECAGLD